MEPLTDLDTDMPEALLLFMSDFYKHHNESEVLVYLSSIWNCMPPSGQIPTISLPSTRNCMPPSGQWLNEPFTVFHMELRATNFLNYLHHIPMRQWPPSTWNWIWYGTEVVFHGSDPNFHGSWTFRLNQHQVRHRYGEFICQAYICLPWKWDWLPWWTPWKWKIDHWVPWQK